VSTGRVDGPRTRPTGRVHGPWAVFAGRLHGPWTRASKNDTRVHGPCWSPKYSSVYSTRISARGQEKCVPSFSPDECCCNWVC